MLKVTGPPRAGQRGRQWLIFLACFIFVAAFIFITCRHKPVSNLAKAVAPETDSNYIGKKYGMPDLNRYFGRPLVDYTDSMTWEGVELGRRLFYDKHLSKSGQRSCASCHNYRYALADPDKRFSTNETGLTARNAPALQNLAWSRSYFWDGRVTSLVSQQKDAFEHELNFKIKDAIPYLMTDTVDSKLFKKAFGRPGVITEDKVYQAVEQFLLSAVSFNSKFDKVIRKEEEFTPSEYRGYYDIFLKPKGECFECHKSPITTILLTDDKFHNNGLDLVLPGSDFTDSGHGKITGKAADNGTFKTPGLRSVALTAPYMHDGRFKTLKQVIDFYSDSIKLSSTLDPHLIPHIDTSGAAGHKNTGGMHFTKAEKQDLLNFLNTLTDTTFINNRALQDPFASKQ